MTEDARAREILAQFNMRLGAVEEAVRRLSIATRLVYEQAEAGAIWDGFMTRNWPEVAPKHWTGISLEPLRDDVLAEWRRLTLDLLGAADTPQPPTPEE